MFNTKEDLPTEYRSVVINDYVQKILNSGYGHDQTRRIVLAGIRGYFGKVKRRRKERNMLRVHYTARETGGSRGKKKLLGKTSWYKQRRSRREEDTLGPGRRGTKGDVRRKRGSQDVKTRAVLFVPQTPMGELARRTREVLQRMEHLTKFRLKVVERAGTSLQNLFSQTAICKSGV